ncbi:uncharacterized protein BDV14DRAFT_86737 [Aspergillus stella-maris]|uniref:uncharacterized protein n=1 Tax=Aspergillus stella-maris TaxID=1810926 RepID=UPI003CCDBCB4
MLLRRWQAYTVRWFSRRTRSRPSTWAGTQSAVEQEANAPVFIRKPLGKEAAGAARATRAAHQAFVGLFVVDAGSESEIRMKICTTWAPSVFATRFVSGKISHTIYMVATETVLPQHRSDAVSATNVSSVKDLSLNNEADKRQPKRDKHGLRLSSIDRQGIEIYYDKTTRNYTITIDRNNIHVFFCRSRPPIWRSNFFRCEHGFCGAIRFSLAGEG